jgi:hypothetical protein
MNLYFDSISDFIKIRERCIFCDQELKPMLANYWHSKGLGLNIRIASNECINNEFSFDFSHVTPDMNVSSRGYLNIESNKIRFDINKNLSSYSSYQDVVKAFERSSPHVTLYCMNKKCKSLYTIFSDVFTFRNFKLKKFNLYMECFNLNRYWIQNDWVHGDTNIYIKSNIDLDPIKIPVLDSWSMDKNKILTTIKNVVIFS